MEENGRQVIEMYMPSRAFSNNKLKLYHPYLPLLLETVGRELQQFDYRCEDIKDYLAPRGSKALVTRTEVNTFNEKIIAMTSGTINFRRGYRKAFTDWHGIKPVCEGCKREPIQEEAHIIRQCHGDEIKNFEDYLNHYANIWLLCATCHRIVDTGGASKARTNLTVHNLQSKDKNQRKIMEDLKKDRDLLRTYSRKLKYILKLPKMEAGRELKKLMK